MVLGVVQKGLNAGLGEAPGTGVERLLLRPDDGLGVGVLVKVLLQLLPREGVELLEASDGDVVDLVVGAVLVQGGVDLASAKNDTLDLLRLLDGTGLVLGVRDDPLEVRVADELVNVGASNGVTKQRLGEEDDEGCQKS